ncbi:MAG: hypothetical protein JJU13_13990 [Balneolaceae bacterium]|nr:hypothetical protein [Balneolaceae bacterium]
MMGINEIKTRFILIIPFIVAVAIVGISCEGPAGPQGETGPEGPQGPVGPAGAGGTVMLAGEGVPSQNTGGTGDFYLDLTSGNLYGPKADEGWGEPLNLKGSQGEDGQDGQDGEDGQDGADGFDGKDGSQIYAGDGAPVNSLGEVGDYYLDRDNYHLYGPKTESGWGAPLDLQGPPGTANVFYSGWLEIEWNSLDNPNWKQMSIDEPAVTEELLESGIILMYVRDVGPQIFALPFVEMVHSYRFFAYPGTIVLVARSTDGSEVDADWITHVRYVLIPGGTSLKVMDSFWKDYEQVREYFGLSD